MSKKISQRVARAYKREAAELRLKLNSLQSRFGFGGTNVWNIPISDAGRDVLKTVFQLDHHLRAGLDGSNLKLYAVRL